LDDENLAFVHGLSRCCAVILSVHQINTELHLLTILEAARNKWGGFIAEIYRWGWVTFLRMMDALSTWTSSVQLHRRQVHCRPCGRRSPLSALQTPTSDVWPGLDPTDDDSRCQVLMPRPKSDDQQQPKLKRDEVVS